MVKGITRRVVVVRPDRGGIFEQAIFIVKSSGGAEEGHGPDDILREACRVANEYSYSAPAGRPGFVKFLKKAAYAAAGGALVGAAWLITAIV